MESIKELNNILARLKEGSPVITAEEKSYLNDLAKYIIYTIATQRTKEMDVALARLIELSNILYNNLSNANLPLDDSVYDQLMVLSQKYNIKVPVGAIPVQFKENPYRKPELDKREDKSLRRVAVVVPDIDKRLFFKQMASNTYPVSPEAYIFRDDKTLVDKKQRTSGHNYDMCGTLSKCKYVLNNDAKEDGVFYTPGISVFERDFIGKHIQEGLIDPEHIHLILSIKYDGISVENTVAGDTITYSCTRGDTANNEASDLTPILGGMKFSKAHQIDSNEVFGIKFEYIITKTNLARIYERFGKSYVNPRNAIIGLFGGLDARRYRDYMTPVPLESSRKDMDRVTEIKFLNQYYSKDIEMRYVEIFGDYAKVMYLIKKFVEEADSLRESMNFAYDGVVVEYADEYIRQRLGKLNSIPRYATAIKFNPIKRVSTFTHYTYSVGSTGKVVPMAHFEPVEFFGAIHDKTTAHSLKRFRELKLHRGDKVHLTLNNDVIVYITKAPDSEQDPNNHNPLEEFPEVCPSCGKPLYVTETGDTAVCINIDCPERNISRMDNMLNRLGIKNFSRESIRALGVTSFTQLIKYPESKMREIIGDGKTDILISELARVESTPIADYRLLGSIGFTGIGETTWKTILQQVPIDRILKENEESMKFIDGIKGIGRKTKNTIIEEFPRYLGEINLLFDLFNYEKTKPFNPNNPIPSVRFTGIRDKNLEKKFENIGFDVDSNGSVTVHTTILVVPYIGFESTKTNRAFSILGKTYAKKHNLKKYDVNWTNLNTCVGLSPVLLTPEQASQYADKFKSYNGGN